MNTTDSILLVILLLLCIFAFCYMYKNTLMYNSLVDTNKQPKLCNFEFDFKKQKYVSDCDNAYHMMENRYDFDPTYNDSHRKVFDSYEDDE